MTIITLKKKRKIMNKKNWTPVPRKRVNFKPPLVGLGLKFGKRERNNAKNWNSSPYPKGTYSLQRDRFRSNIFLTRGYFRISKHNFEII
jgi:hypothetical protein